MWTSYCGKKLDTTSSERKGWYLERSEGKQEPSSASTRSTKGPRSEANGEGNDGLEMAPELMLDLARKAAELVVERIENLPGENAWDGEFRQGHCQVNGFPREQATISSV